MKRKVVRLSRAPESAVRTSLRDATKSIRERGAVTSVTVIGRGDGSTDVYLSGLDAERAIGAMVRAMISVHRDANGE